MALLAMEFVSARARPGACQDSVLAGPFTPFTPDARAAPSGLGAREEGFLALRLAFHGRQGRSPRVAPGPPLASGPVKPRPAKTGEAFRRLARRARMLRLAGQAHVPRRARRAHFGSSSAGTTVCGLPAGFASLGPPARLVTGTHHSGDPDGALQRRPTSAHPPDAGARRACPAMRLRLCIQPAIVAVLSESRQPVRPPCALRHSHRRGFTPRSCGKPTGDLGGMRRKPLNSRQFS